MRGVVYEAMYEPGRYDPYVFKDGVTVYVADPNRMPVDGHCTDEQLEFYLRLTDADLKPYTGRYARIASTTREQYRAPAARNGWATATGIAASSGSTSSGDYTGRHGNRMKTG